MRSTMQRVLQKLGFHRPPAAVRGAHLIVADPAVLAAAGPFLGRLPFDTIPVAAVAADAIGAEEEVAAAVLPAAPHARARWLSRAAPQSVILLGNVAGGAALSRALDCPVYWVNAPGRAAAEARCELLTLSSPSLQQELPHAHLTGDPLLGLTTLPPAPEVTDLCGRFREQRRTGRWILYYAGTGVDEEPIAYGSFFKLARRKMGFLAVAPRDPERYEPVYRNALKYRLPTNRHNRLSTSCVPLATRVYYIEDPETLDAMYHCADVVVAGGSLTAQAQAVPNLIPPLLAGKPILVGPAFAADPLSAAAVRDGAALAAADEDSLVEAAHTLLTDETERSRMAEHANAWVMAQPGAEARVLELLTKKGR